MGYDLRKFTGWVQDTRGIQQAARKHGQLRRVASQLLGGEQRDVHLWMPLLKCKPTWRRRAQAIGDCVSWGAELAVTMLMAIDAVDGKGTWIEEAATESIYGGCRVEVLKKTRGGRSDGAFGYAAAEWLKQYGVTLRKDYSRETGNAEHDLRVYSGKKAKDWGDFGCGGASDKGKLDEVAKLHPVEHIAQVKKVEEAIASLQNEYPVTIASSAGFGDMRRDANGLCYWVDTWYHQMELGAIRWRSGKPEFRVFQSWGDSCSGPDPGMEDLMKDFTGAIGGDGASEALPSGALSTRDFMRRLILPDEAFPFHVQSAAEWNPISACSWWINEATLAKILSTGDCWTISGVTGFAPRKLDVRKAVTNRLQS